MPAWPLSLASQLKQKSLYIRLFRSTGSCPAVSQNYPRDLQQGRKSDINILSSAASTHWCATTATSVRLSRTVRVENHEKTLVAADVPGALAVGTRRAARRRTVRRWTPRRPGEQRGRPQHMLQDSVRCRVPASVRPARRRRSRRWAERDLRAGKRLQPAARPHTLFYASTPRAHGFPRCCIFLLIVPRNRAYTRRHFQD